MNSNQRSQVNNQTDNGANVKRTSSYRSDVEEHDQRQHTLSEESQRTSSMQSAPEDDPSWGREGKAQPTGASGQSQQGDLSQSAPQQHGARDSTNRTGSQTGSQQNDAPAVHESNDVAGGLPRSPGGKHLAADQKMDDDTGLSNTVNRQVPIDDGTKQTQQSNVGRRSDLTAD